MNVQLSTAELITLLMCTLRTSIWLAVVPPFAGAGIPNNIKVMLGVALSLPMIPMASAHAPAAELAPLVSCAFEQLLIGGGLGFLTRMLFSALESAGSLIDVVGGFSLSVAYDPLQANSVSIFGKFYGLMTTTLLFATPAHEVILQGFARSYDGIPLDGTLNMSHFGAAVVSGLSTMFVSALQIAGPLIAILFLADVALGLLSRISPQLNVFQMSFPFKIMITLGLVGLGFSLMPQTVNQIAANATGIVVRLSGGA
jgi:flagellar biosynthesis protein FliR